MEDMEDMEDMEVLIYFEPYLFDVCFQRAEVVVILAPFARQ